jgi:RNA polymerase sigma-70 factor, ECF subfamily
MTPGRLPATGAGDPILVARVRAGDGAAFDAIVVAHFPSMVEYGAALVGSRAAAEDVAQIVLTRVWRRRHAWRVTTTIRTYLLSAVRHEASNHRRADRIDARRRAALECHVAAQGDRVDRDDDPVSDRAEVAALLATLSPRRRDAIVLRYGLGLTVPEIGRVLGITTKAAEQLVMRSLRALRDSIRR